MNVEHRTHPVEHWIVDGNAYRLATEADVGKEVYRTDITNGVLEATHLAGTALLTKYDPGNEKPYVCVCRWRFAYVQDDSLLTSQRVPVPELGAGWFLLTADDGEIKPGDKIRAGYKGIATWTDLPIGHKWAISTWIRDGHKAARYFGVTEPAAANNEEIEPTPAIDWTKPVRTKDGRAVRVLCTDGPNAEYPVIGIVSDLLDISCWALSGQYETGYTGDHDLENIPPEPKRIQKTWWMNVLEDGHFYEYSSKEEADSDRTSDTLACIPFTIDCTEGEGL